MNYTFNCKGRLLCLEQPAVMGILNATPDSFYTRGRHNNPDAMVAQAEAMIGAGARILDIGGMSTRPDAPEVTQQEELDRVLPVISAIKTAFPDIFISIDTYRAAVAAQAVAAGADIVNDISAGDADPGMLDTVARLEVPYIAMHMQGMPATMQYNPQYGNVVQEVLNYFIRKLQACSDAGIRDVILDPGFGFGKTIAHNYQLLKGLYTLQLTGKAILVGVSRKSMIYKFLETGPEEALNGTTALHMLALQQGAALLRVHDVKEASECIKIFNYFQTISEL